ncbi:family 43 glycosylhydrolase [Hymenobacter sp. GOD-10R]|uniref:family 43 glycosylhydrolase n=1 Tax=Hymenobacter sp. GOD-10R TaxID=3093922 RepID=UPI002D7870EB|nr:family 43 glycosylhydrolase [Hymenobacter sp. GOD-10R]WRQ27765.1 family 43 glycosylhydrolase [Hymenobacter sp. GOD-10R]
MLLSNLKHTLSFLLVGALLLPSCQQHAATGTTDTATTPAASTEAPIANPVLAGDYPDPSVTKIGDTYWATATTSNWGAIFPLLKSKDLTNWQLVGHVFPDGPPAWADYYFWAPEISEDGGKVYVYYTAHRKGGPLSVGVARADNPAGPYQDLGPLVGQPDGSIDAFPMRDENGVAYLIWKEDGNSANKPTPIWAQRINDAHTALTGEKTELFRNTAPWEGNLVEGVSMVRHEGYFYAFYAANGCCGRGCTYATGVARSRTLLGPWEKYAQNPILVKNDVWTCPGHGTAISRGNRWFMLHHAYNTNGFENVGRQGVLSEFRWNADGWPEFLDNHSVPTPLSANTGGRDFTDEFNGATLAPTWQWPVEEKPQFALRGGKLLLTARTDHSGAALGQSLAVADYAATTTLDPTALPASTVAGLAALGDPNNTLALLAGEGKLRLRQMKGGKPQMLGEVPVPTGKTLHLQLQARSGNQYRFSWSTDGKTWQNLPADGAAVDGSYLPPWDRGVRVGVLAQGPSTSTVGFEAFQVASLKR